MNIDSLMTLLSLQQLAQMSDLCHRQMLGLAIT